MSESNSQPLPISGFRSDEGHSDSDDGLDLGFDGAEDILRTLRRGIRPDPDLTMSEWADQHAGLSARATAEPKRWRTAWKPYLREIIDALSQRCPTQRISFMKAAGVGAAEAGNNWIGFVIHRVPGPMLAVSQTVEMAKLSSRGWPEPLIEDSPALRGRVKPARPRDAAIASLKAEPKKPKTVPDFVHLVLAHRGQTPWYAPNRHTSNGRLLLPPGTVFLCR